MIFYLYKILNTNQSYSIKLTTYLFVSVETTFSFNTRTISINMIHVENDYEPIIYEQPIYSHIYQNHDQFLLNYYTKLITSNKKKKEKIEKIVEEITEEKPTKTQANNPQSSTRIYFQDNPYTFEERHARLSEPLEPVLRQAASLSEPQYEPVYNIYPTLQQDLNTAKHQNQNQNTLEINRKIIHPRRNRNLQTPRVQFNIPHSTITNPIDLSSSTIQSTPQTPTQQRTFPQII